MESDERRAIQAIKRLAERRVASKVSPILEKKALNTLKDLELPKEEIGAALRIGHDLIKGETELPLGRNTRLRVNPKKKSIGLQFNKSFD